MTNDFQLGPNTLDYLKQFNQGGHFEPGELTVPRKKKKLKINHGEALRWMIKAIKLCRMDKELKGILLMRMGGDDPDKFHPKYAMTCRDISIKKGIRLAVVEDFEREGKARLKQFLKGKSLSDIIFTFNREQLGGNVLVDKTGKPITG